MRGGNRFNEGTEANGHVTCEHGFELCCLYCSLDPSGMELRVAFEFVQSAGKVTTLGTI